MKDAPLILVADDEPVNLTILTWVLNEAGFEVLAAANGFEACELAARHRPDLIILDILMPGENGYAVCKRLQRTPATQGTPIIFISGLTDSSDKERGLELGAVDFITKPFSRQEILDRVCVHLRPR